MFRDGCHGDHILDIDIDFILTSADVLFITIGEKHLCGKLAREKGVLPHPEKGHLQTQRRVFYSTLSSSFHMF